MMIPYVDAQLAIWGKAQLRDARKGLGFSSVCPMFRDMKHGGVYGSQVPCGVSLTDLENIADTDVAVSRLPIEQRQLVVEFYVVGGKIESIADRLGIAKRTLYDRLHVLHQQVLGLLNDVAAGV